MMYHKDLKVIIKNKEGKYLNGIILDSLDFGSQEAWWVQYEESGHIEVNVMTSDQLDLWNEVTLTSLCVCGSAKAGVSNRHAYYCDVK